MRVLIGNHIDVSIRRRKDMRSWTQRILWFARQGDLIVLPDHPDEEFLRYVTSLTGVDRSSLTVLVPPPGEFGNHLLDAGRLADEGFRRQVAAELEAGPEVSEVFALWPSSQVSRFAEALQLSKRLPAADFFAQGGGQIVNNKANFRALAAAAGVPTARGEVCHSLDEAVDATGRLLSGAQAVVVKQAHNGAGSGNQAVVRGDGVETGHAGTKHLHHLAPGAAGIRAYWLERWEWASAGGRFPVVIEEFRQRATSVYSEYHVGDEGIRPTEAGILHYVGRSLSHQGVPLRGIDEEVRERLVAQGRRLAEIYRSVGYRGYLSADAVVDGAGEVVFTEVNAQVSGSVHLYRTIAHEVVDVWREPMRTVVEYHWPAHWGVAGFEEFIEAVGELGCRYDAESRTGVILSTPFDEIRGLVFCIVHAVGGGPDETYRKLDARFRTASGADGD